MTLIKELVDKDVKTAIITISEYLDGKIYSEEINRRYK